MAKDDKKKDDNFVGELWKKAARAGLRGSRAKIEQKRRDKKSGYKKKKRAK